MTLEDFVGEPETQTQEEVSAPEDVFATLQKLVGVAKENATEKKILDVGVFGLILEQGTKLVVSDWIGQKDLARLDFEKERYANQQKLNAELRSKPTQDEKTIKELPTNVSAFETIKEYLIRTYRALGESANLRQDRYTGKLKYAITESRLFEKLEQRGITTEDITQFTKTFNNRDITNDLNFHAQEAKSGETKGQVWINIIEK